MSGVFRLVPGWIWLLLVLAAFGGVQHWRLASAQAELAILTQRETEATVRAASLRGTLKLQRELTNISHRSGQQHQEELVDADQKIADLGRDLATARRRLSVHAVCVSNRAGTPVGTSGADAGTAELTADARQAYLDLRTGIERQRLQIVGLQRYIRELEQAERR